VARLVPLIPGAATIGSAGKGGNYAAGEFPRALGPMCVVCGGLHRRTITRFVFGEMCDARATALERPWLE